MLMGRAEGGGGGGAELPGRWCTGLSRPGTSPAAGQRSPGFRRREESGTLPTRRPRRSAPLPFPAHHAALSDLADARAELLGVSPDSHCGINARG